MHILRHAYYQQQLDHLAENSGVSDQIAAAALLSSTDFAIYNVMPAMVVAVLTYVCVCLRHIICMYCSPTGMSLPDKDRILGLARCRV